MNIHNILRPLYLITLSVQLSGCSIWDWAIGSRTIDPAACAIAEASGRANCVKNRFGETIECCCITICSTSEDIERFSEEFARQLEDRHDIGSLVEIREELAQICSTENGLTFSIDNAPPGAPGPVTITWDEFGSDDPTLQSRSALKNLLNYFERNAKEYNLKLIITLRKCPTITNAASRCSANQSMASASLMSSESFRAPHMSQTADATGQQESEEEECRPCEVPATEHRKHTLNWTGLF